MNLQVVKLAEAPPNVSEDLLRIGIQMNIPSVQGVTDMMMENDRFVLAKHNPKPHHIILTILFPGLKILFLWETMRESS